MDPISNNPPRVVPDNGSNKHGITDHVRDTLEGVSHKVGEAASKVQDTATRVSRSSRQMVKDNPMRAMAISAGAGIIVGLILARSLFR